MYYKLITNNNNLKLTVCLMIMNCKLYRVYNIEYKKKNNTSIQLT